MHLKRVKHALPRDNNLIGHLFDWERANKGGHLLSGLPFGKLAKALLAGPHRGVDNLQEELPSPRVEDKNGPVDRFGGLKGGVGLECGEGETVRAGRVKN